jgi:pimeloyl-ACP methyl ester carboxylesterase
MKKMLFWILGIITIFYLLVCVFIYFYQEKLIFYPEKLSYNYQFRFDGNFQERFIQTSDGKRLHGLLFKSQLSKGLILYLHGNAGAVDSWGQIAGVYTSLQYDIFILDYRGFGKSEGNIVGEKQFYADVEAAYEELKKSYDEKNIVIIGFSIGSAAAARLASLHHPKMLILQAPYYSLTDLIRHISPMLFLSVVALKYKFNTWQFVKHTKVPVAIFHGDRDEVIYYGSSVKLKQHFKPNDVLIILKGQAHNGINENTAYILALRKLLTTSGKD